MTDPCEGARPRGRRTRSTGGTLVIGLGNPILGDDGVGWRVIDALEERLERRDATDEGLEEARLERACVGGVALMEQLTGVHRAIIVDAVEGGSDGPGRVWCRPLSEVVNGSAGHLDSSHDASLRAALDAGRALGALLPDDIFVVGVVTERAEVFGEGLSEPVAAAVPEAADLVLAALRRAVAGAVG